MSLGDLFRISEFKNTIQKSKVEIVQLEETIDKLKKQNNIKLSLQQMKPEQLDQLINSKHKTLDELDKQIDLADKKRINALSEIEKQSDMLNEIKADISDLSPDLEMSSYGLYHPQYDFSDSLGYKDELKEIRDQQKFFIKHKMACAFNENWQVNGSVAQGKKMIRNTVKAILRSFNNECTDAINKVTYSNYDRIETRIKRSFDQHNKMYEVDQVSLNEDYLALKLAELELAFEYRQKVQEEKDKLREQRAREKEEKALQREIKAQQKMLNKQIDHYSKAIQELQERQNEDPHNDGLIAEIEKLKQKLTQYEDKKAAVDYREENATAGYVYIISNVGSFGKNVFKIGVTRRLDPMDRINELGSASVPFKFDVHALIFSENAYQLESELHQRFSQKRVNMVNNRKEYFHISINEIEDELKKYSNLTVDFKEAPEAEEYRESLAISTESKQ